MIAPSIDPVVFDREMSLLRRSWIPAAHVSDLAKPGDFVSLVFAGRRIVVTRTTEFTVAAFMNVCPHRGTVMLDEGAGHLPTLEIVCPYHGLRADLRGRIDASDVATFKLPPGACLTSLPTAERHGFVFVKATPGESNFDAETGPAPPWFDRTPLAQLRRGRRTQTEVAANWKLCVENFQESHHFSRVHPSLERVTPAARSTSMAFGGLYLGGTMQIANGSDTVSEDGRLIGAPMLAAPEDRRTVFDALLFPVWMTSLQPDYFLSYVLYPISVARTGIVADIYFHQSMKPGVDPARIYSFWDRTNREDQAVIGKQQLGLMSVDAFEGTLADSEDGIVSFRALLSRALEPWLPT